MKNNRSESTTWNNHDRTRTTGDSDFNSNLILHDDSNNKEDGCGSMNGSNQIIKNPINLAPVESNSNGSSNLADDDFSTSLDNLKNEAENDVSLDFD